VALAGGKDATEAVETAKAAAASVKIRYE
jgi:hypothetical protein